MTDDTRTDETALAEPAGEVPADKPAALSKAERLEAKAARLREAEREKAERTAAAAAAPPGRRGVPAWTLVAAGIAILALIGGLVFSIVEWRQADSRAGRAHAQVSQADSVDSLRESALAAAKQDAVDFASYNYTTLAADFARARSHLTPDFAAKYDQISAQLREVIVQYRGESKATVLAAAVQSVAPKQAVVLLFVDQTITTNQSKTPRVDRNRMQLTMQRTKGGGWLISDLLLK